MKSIRNIWICWALSIAAWGCAAETGGPIGESLGEVQAKDERPIRTPDEWCGFQMAHSDYLMQAKPINLAVEGAYDRYEESVEYFSKRFFKTGSTTQKALQAFREHDGDLFAAHVSNMTDVTSAIDWLTPLPPRQRWCALFALQRAEAAWRQTSSLFRLKRAPIKNKEPLEVFRSGEALPFKDAQTETAKKLGYDLRVHVGQTFGSAWGMLSSVSRYAEEQVKEMNLRVDTLEPIDIVDIFWALDQLNTDILRREPSDVLAPYLRFVTMIHPSNAKVGGGQANASVFAVLLGLVISDVSLEWIRDNRRALIGERTPEETSEGLKVLIAGVVATLIEMGTQGDELAGQRPNTAFLYNSLLQDFGPWFNKAQHLIAQLDSALVDDPTGGAFSAGMYVERAPFEEGGAFSADWFNRFLTWMRK